MDFISHGLWGGLIFGRKNKKQFVLAFFLSILPDIFSEGIMFFFIFLNLPGMPSLANGHPNIIDFPIYAQNLYNATHSLVIFIIIFMIVLIFTKKPIWIISTWALHILIDIPTHSLEMFPTPFLWPISNFRFNGISWDNPYIIGVDLFLLLIAYSIWLYPKIKNSIKKQTI